MYLWDWLEAEETAMRQVGSWRAAAPTGAARARPTSAPALPAQRWWPLQGPTVHAPPSQGQELGHEVEPEYPELPPVDDVLKRTA
jgi:hypothetical protein